MERLHILVEGSDVVHLQPAMRELGLGKRHRLALHDLGERVRFLDPLRPVQSKRLERPEGCSLLGDRIQGLLHAHTEHALHGVQHGSDQADLAATGGRTAHTVEVHVVRVLRPRRLLVHIHIGDRDRGPCVRHQLRVFDQILQQNIQVQRAQVGRLRRLVEHDHIADDIDQVSRRAAIVRRDDHRRHRVVVDADVRLPVQVIHEVE